MKTFAISRFALGVSVAAAFLMGCGGTQSPIGAPEAMQQGRPTAVHADRSGSWMLPEAKNQDLLYVGSGTRLSEYIMGQTKPFRSLKKLSQDVCTLALDSGGDAYAGNCDPSYAVISVYDRQLKLIRSIIGLRALALAVDRYGYLYIATCTRDIYVFAPGQTNWDYVLTHNPYGACRLAIDASGDLFVASSHSISVYAPNAAHDRMKYIRKITSGVKHPTALAFGPSGNLFIASCTSCGFSSGKHRDWVSVYSPDGSKPEGLITDGINGPRLLATDRSGRLYVGNIPLRNGRPQTGFISVYAPEGHAPVQKLTDEIDSPSALAIDPSANLYVANYLSGTVTVYSPGGTKLLSTIKAGVGIGPTSMALGPQ